MKAVKSEDHKRETVLGQSCNSLQKTTYRITPNTIKIPIQQLRTITLVTIIKIPKYCMLNLNEYEISSQIHRKMWNGCCECVSRKLLFDYASEIPSIE